MPKTPTPWMVEHAESLGFVGRQLQEAFDDWRDHHIANGTKIHDERALWRVWMRRREERRREKWAREPKAPRFFNGMPL